MSSGLRPQNSECVGRWEEGILTGRQGVIPQGDMLLLHNNHEGVASVEEGQSKTAESLTGKPGLNEDEASSRIVEKGEAKAIEVIGTGPIAFVADGDYIVSGNGSRIRRWRVEDGKEDGQPMRAGSEVWSIAVSRDEKWIVSGTSFGQVTVWDAGSHSKAIEFRGHGYRVVYAVDVSSDGTRIATGSSDWTVCVWSLSTGKKLLGPFKHDDGVTAVKFSPDGRCIATATWRRSVRIYDSHDGCLLVDTPIQVGSLHNQSLAWTGLGKEFLALSKDGDIHCIDVATGTTLSKWAIHSDYDPECIALTNHSAFIAASANSSVSLWDMATHKQIGPLIHHPGNVRYLAISPNQDLAISGGEKIILRKLPDILPSSYFDHVCVLSPMPAKETLFTMSHLQQLPEALGTSAEERRREEMIESIRTEDRRSSESCQEVVVQPLVIEEFPPPQRDERERNTDTYNIPSNFPYDLTGHVTKSSGFPVASGSHGDIYKGTLNVTGGSSEVRYCLFW